MSALRVFSWQRAAVATVAAVVLATLWLRLGPVPAGLLDTDADVSTLVLDRHGDPLYEALSASATRLAPLNAGELPPLVVEATVAAEDRRFRSHVGVDPVAVLRAIRINLSERRVVEGGSTITQQTAKLLLNRQDPARSRGVAAKLREAILAIRLEHRLSKDEILALYLNHAYYGNQIVGADRASRAYFGKPASMLTPAQAAFLAGLPQRPSRFNPYRHLDLALSRQRTVLRRMAAAGTLTAEQLDEARDERLTLSPLETPFVAPHFVEMVLASLGDTRPPRVVTSVDRGLQEDVNGVVISQREVLRAHGAANVAVVVLDNATGGWLAWEGSGDYANGAGGGTINGPTIPRQPGSALKPFTYALAFEGGASPATVLADIPSHFATAQPGVVYSPRNYDGRFRGPLLARRALAGSENVPAVALASDLGVPNLLRFLSRAGLTTFEKNAAFYGLGVTLGNAEVRLDELVAAYAAFARGGTWIRPTMVAGESMDPGMPLVSPRTAFWVTDILSDAEAREYVFGRGGSLEFPFPVAVKTGTSQAYRDNWTVGYSRHVTVGVWVGNFDRTPLRNSSGVTGAAPIFHAVMLAAERRMGGDSVTHDDRDLVAPPADVRRADICALSGMAATPLCPLRKSEWLAEAGELSPCSWHRQTESGTVVVWPPQYREWATSNGLDGRATSPIRLVADHTAPPSKADSRVPLRIVNPPEGATYLIDPTLRQEFQTLPLKVMAADAGPIEWTVDGARAGAAHSSRTLAWPLTPGSHRIVARDGNGRSSEASIVVR